MDQVTGSALTTCRSLLADRSLYCSCRLAKSAMSFRRCHLVRKTSAVRPTCAGLSAAFLAPRRACSDAGTRNDQAVARSSFSNFRIDLGRDRGLPVGTSIVCRAMPIGPESPTSTQSLLSLRDARVDGDGPRRGEVSRLTGMQMRDQASERAADEDKGRVQASGAEQVIEFAAILRTVGHSGPSSLLANPAMSYAHALVKEAKSSTTEAHRRDVAGSPDTIVNRRAPLTMAQQLHLTPAKDSYLPGRRVPFQCTVRDELLGHRCHCQGKDHCASTPNECLFQESLVEGLSWNSTARS